MATVGNPWAQGRWQDFSDILDNPEENFRYSIYRPFSTYDETRAAIERTVTVVTAEVGMWIYPQELIKIQTHDGKIVNTDVIFLVKPRVDVLQNDYIERLGRDRILYRVGGINDLLSHKELFCYRPDQDFQGLDNSVGTEINAFVI